MTPKLKLDGRRAALVAAAAMLLGLASAGGAGAAHPPRTVEVTGLPQLFLHDDRLIASREGLELVPAAVTKHPGNPVLTNDQPWEQGSFGFACVIYDAAERRYKMWYEVRAEEDRGRCLYATSKDGLHWEKPILNLIEFEGSRANNIVFIGPGNQRTKSYWVIKDYAEPDPARRYKMMHHFWDFGGRGVSIATSPDGLRWNAGAFVNLHGGFDTLNMMLFDDRIGQYVGYFRTRAAGRRYIGRSVSPDGFHWSKPVTVHGPDADDPAASDIYTPGVFKYARADDVYVMATAFFDYPTDRLWGQLALSRDGIEWKRFRHAFLPLGAEGQWDQGSIFPTPSDVTIDGKAAIYYRGSRTGHGVGGEPGVGVAFVRDAGFAGWRAKGDGSLVTQPLLVSHHQYEFFLNADASQGEIRVELLDASGAVVPGFSRAECRPIAADGKKLLVAWSPGKPLTAAIRSGAVKLRLFVRNATVYGFQCGDADDRPARAKRDAKAVKE